MVSLLAKAGPLIAAGLLANLWGGAGIIGAVQAEPRMNSFPVVRWDSTQNPPSVAGTVSSKTVSNSSTTMGREARIPIAAATVMATPSPSYFSFSDTVVSYRFQGPSAEPGLKIRRADGREEGRDVPKNVINFFHTNVWSYGTNIISIDILQSGSQDPAGNKYGSFEGIGATELYLIYRGVLSPNKIFQTDIFAVPGLVKDIGLSFGADINAKNTTFNPQKRAGTFGLNFAFDVPTGFVNLKVQGYKEFSHNGFAGLEPGPVPGFDYSRFRSVEFKMTPEFELTYAFPLHFMPLPLSIAGFSSILLPKGRYGIYNEKETQLEFVSQTNLVLDIGQLINQVPNQVEGFIGFQYWHNKFGGDPRRTVNTEEKAVIAGIALHLK